jgi:hypothetical protein
MFYAIIQATIALIVILGLPISREAEAAILVLVALVIGFLTKRQVTPTATLPTDVQRQIRRDRQL